MALLAELFVYAKAHRSPCHRGGAVVADLKPANVFLDENNYIRVGDLGLSKILEFTLQQAKTQCGTPAFMAPELCKVHPLFLLLLPLHIKEFA